MNILVFGAGSKLSYSLYNLVKANSTYNITWISSKEIPDLFSTEKWITGDILDDKFVENIVKSENPNLIINLASYTNVDGCEDDKITSLSVNYEFPLLLSNLIKDSEIKLIHISTDYVFDGNEGLYKIEDEPSDTLQSWYSITKRDSEKLILDAGGCVIRTNVLYGSESESPDFLSWLSSKINSGESSSVVYDQFNNPTLYKELALSILKVIEKDIKGIIHSGGIDWISRWELAQVFALSHGKNPEDIDMKPISTKDLNQKAYRPLYGGLDIEESENILDMKFSGVYDFIIEQSSLNTDEMQNHFTIFKRLISILRKLSSELRRCVFISCKKNPHNTISILLESKSVWSEIEIGLNSYSGLIYVYNGNSELNLQVGDIYDEETIDSFINSVNIFFIK
jgi:dTDP-4-dehydrorhamnose reductase